MGLIKCGSVVIPFDNQISKDTDLYRLYNTNIHEKIEMMKKENINKKSLRGWLCLDIIKMYLKVGEFLSKETERASYGDAYIDEISREIQEAFPGIKGFNRRGLYRMKNFMKPIRIMRL